jgi:hypothetical protein
VQQSGPQRQYSEINLPLDGGVQRSNAGYLAPGQTKIAVNIDNITTTSNVTVPLPTPPAGKTWLITDMILTHTASTGQRMAVTSGGVVIFSTQSHGSAAPDIMNGIESQLDVPGGIAPALAITGASGMSSYAWLSGIQQNLGGG